MEGTNRNNCNAIARAPLPLSPRTLVRCIEAGAAVWLLAAKGIVITTKSRSIRFPPVIAYLDAGLMGVYGSDTI